MFALAIYVVVHTRVEWIAGVVPERVYVRNAGVAVFCKMLVVN
jgi:hypothetical protein